MLHWELSLKVETLSAEHRVLHGLYLHFPVKSPEVGTIEMIQTQEHNKYQDAPDGLFQLVHNYEIQDTVVELFGRALLHTTGLVQKSNLHLLLV